VPVVVSVFAIYELAIKVLNEAQAYKKVTSFIENVPIFEAMHV
jgi:hypothetical protein